MLGADPQPADRLHPAAAEFLQTLRIQRLDARPQLPALLVQPLAQHLVRAAFSDGAVDLRCGFSLHGYALQILQVPGRTTAPPIDNVSFR